MGEAQKAEAQAVAELVEAKPRVFQLDEREVIVVPGPNGAAQVLSTRKLLEPYDEGPRHRHGIARFSDLDSFVLHVERFKGSTSALFADNNDGAPALVSVFDYHQGGADVTMDDGGSATARWCKHRGVYRFPLSEEWQAWTNASKAPMTQAQFAEFLESRIVDIIDPKKAGESIGLLVEQLGVTPVYPAAVLEVSRGLTIRQNSTVANHVTLATGETQLQYATEHSDEKGQPIKVPGAFLIGIPVFEEGDSFQALVRLRYRIVDRAVRWSIEVFGLDRLLDVAFRTACSDARDRTMLPLFYGTPEA
jgi:hypothetical protein